MRGSLGLLFFLTLGALGCRTTLPGSASNEATVAHSRLSAYSLLHPPVLTPVSAEAAAANKARGDAALPKGDLLLYGATAGLVVMEVDGTKMLERGNLDLPGATGDMASVGKFVYAAQGPAGLAVIDLQDPASPKAVAYLDTPGGCVRLWSNGNEVVVAEGSLGLAVLDARKPDEPRAVATWQGRDYVRHAIGLGKYIYAADGRAGIAVLQRRNDKLQELSRLEPGGDARALFVQGGKLLAALGSGGLAVYDIADPAQPAWVSTMKVPDAARDVEADEKHAFVAGGEAGLLVVDLTAAKAPSVVSTLSTTTPVNRVRLQGNRAFVGADSKGLLIVDISDRARPRQTHPPSDSK
jgi:hypothetical protein